MPIYIKAASINTVYNRRNKLIGSNNIKYSQEKLLMAAVAAAKILLIQFEDRTKFTNTTQRTAIVRPVQQEQRDYFHDNIPQASPHSKKIQI